jgi:hypothetical protein
MEKPPLPEVSNRVRIRSFPHRVFTVFDELILIIPLAAAIVVTRAFLEHERQPTLRSQESWIWGALDWVPIITLGLLPRYAVLGMIALCFLRLRRPRPNWRRSSRQPGFVACAAVTVAALPGVVLVLARYLCELNPLVAGPSIGTYYVNDWTFGFHDWPIIESRISTAVLAAWGALWFSGRWRPEPSWIDRAGSILGGYWAGLWLFRWYLALSS